MVELAECHAVLEDRVGKPLTPNEGDVCGRICSETASDIAPDRACSDDTDVLPFVRHGRG